MKSGLRSAPVRLLFASSLLLMASHVSAISDERLHSMLEELGHELEVRPQGGVGFSYHGVSMMLFSSAEADRMRVMAPVAALATLSSEQLLLAMQANIHSALDVRYGISGQTLYAAFLHPLSALSEQEFESALGQLANLVLTFGSEYSSTGLTFGR